MGSVLIDNWNLSNANLAEIYNHTMPNKACSDLLSALVLWDDVYYLDDGFLTYGWINGLKGEKLLSVLKPLYLEEEIKKQFEKSSNIIYKQKFMCQYKEVVAKRALFYHEISKAFGIDYYPIEQRANFLDQSMNSLELWSRNVILNNEEKEILRRIQEFDKEKEAFIKLPILTNLIMKNSDGDFLNTALEIKNTREVKNFRKYMNKIDQEINAGNYSEAKCILKNIPYIIDDIEKMDRNATIFVDVKIKLTPMILGAITGAFLTNTYSPNELLNYGLICFTLGEIFKESKIEIKKEWRNTIFPKKVQLNFLRTLAKEYIR